MLSTVEVAVSKPVAQPWSHLPNAALIDLILADLRARSAVWVAGRPPSRYSAAKVAARNAALGMISSSEPRRLAWICRAISGGVPWSARDAVLTLIAWDDCGHLLSTDPKQVEVLALLGHHPSVLLYPASLSLHNHKEAV